MSLRRGLKDRNPNKLSGKVRSLGILYEEKDNPHDHCLCSLLTITFFRMVEKEVTKLFTYMCLVILAIGVYGGKIDFIARTPDAVITLAIPQKV